MRWVGRLLLIAGALLVVLPAWTLSGRYAGSIYSTSEALPGVTVALVFGAGYWPDGTPSNVMKDRVEAAAELYFAGRVQSVLFSGDNHSADYDEPGKMAEYALGLGLPEEAIFLDPAGRRTYDTCYRAREVFGLGEAVLVTQRYHLPRALYTCQSLGVDAVGYVADRRPYVYAPSYWLREVPALWLAWLERWVSRPTVLADDPIPMVAN